MKSEIIFFTTIADVPKNHPLYDQRKKQYETALTKVFSYKIPIHGVISETNSETQTMLPSDTYPFTSLHIIPTTAKYNCVGKSIQEYTSMKLALEHLPPESGMISSTWIIKISGRYLLLDDTFINTVRTAPDTCNFIGQQCDNGTQLRTFLYAIRYKYFYRFLRHHYTFLGYKNIEKYLLEFLHEEGIYESSIFVEYLGIYANICDSKSFLTF